MSRRFDVCGHIVSLGTFPWFAYDAIRRAGTAQILIWIDGRKVYAPAATIASSYPITIRRLQ